MSGSDDYPDDGELVLGTVENIFNQGAFITLDEYDGKKGMLHISEISLKWVRNIRDYVREGQKVVLQTLKVNPSKGHVDLSLRRVSDSQRKAKLQEVKKRQRSVKIISLLAKEVGGDKDNMLKKIEGKLPAEYDNIYACFEAVLADDSNADKLGLPKKTRDALVDLVGRNIKPSYVEITGYVELKNYSPDGVEIIKKALKSTIKKGEIGVEVTYVSAPVYKLKVTSSEYKKAEKALKKAADECIQYNNKNGGEGVFHREMSK